jgi:outer membrane receptor for ferrienterochelin and colicins
LLLGRTLRAAALLVTLALAPAASLRGGAASAQSDPAGDPGADRETEEEIEKLDLQALLETPIDVWTATKTVQRTHDAPAVITTITREQIAVLGYRSIAELLGHVLGFYIVDDHVTPNVAVRGSSGGLYSDSSIIKVMIDGHSIAFSPTGGNWLGPELIPLQAVERVEIIRGPASALYGADAFLGVVNIKTRDGKGINGGAGSVAAGMSGRNLASDFDLALGGGRGPIDFMVSYRRHQTDLSGLALPASSPAPSIPAYNAGASRARGLDQGSQTALGRVTLRLRPGSEVGLFSYYSSMERGAEFASLYQLANGYDQRNTFFENRVSQWQMRHGLHAEHEVSQRLRLALRGQYFEGRPRKSNRLEVGSDFHYVRRSFHFRGTDVDAHAVWTPVPVVRLVMGGSLMVDDERLPSRIGIAKQPFTDLRAGEILEGVSVRQGRKMFVNSGAYLQGTWDLFDQRLGLTGGLRYDRHNIYGDRLSERVGLVASPRPDLHAKLLYGSAFKAPSPLLLYSVPSAPGDVLGNAELAPQRVRTAEAQLVHEPWPSLTLSTGLAYSLLEDKTEFIQQSINKVARNVARATTLSWESMATARPSEWLNAQASFELQRTRQRTGQGDHVGEVIGSAGSIYPHFMVHASVVVQPPRFPLRLATLLSVIGPRPASGTNVLLAAGAYTLPTYALLQGKLSTRGFKLLREGAQELSFALSGTNLLGATGPAPGFSGVDYPLAPRTWFLEMNLLL